MAQKRKRDNSGRWDGRVSYLPKKGSIWPPSGVCISSSPGLIFSIPRTSMDQVDKGKRKEVNRNYYLRSKRSRSSIASSPTVIGGSEEPEGSHQRFSPEPEGSDRGFSPEPEGSDLRFSPERSPSGPHWPPVDPGPAANLDFLPPFDQEDSLGQEPEDEEAADELYFDAFDDLEEGEEQEMDDFDDSQEETEESDSEDEAEDPVPPLPQAQPLSGDWPPFKEVSFEPEHLDPLYEGAPLTMLESFLILLQVFLKFHLCKDAMDAFCEVLCLHLPKESKNPKSERELRHFFQSIDSQTVIKHDFCGTCHHLFEEGEFACPLCPNQPRFGAGGTTPRFFLEFPIDSILRERFKDIAFLQAIRYPIIRRATHKDGYLEDILDGSEYTKHQFLENYGNISFIFNTDGLSVFRSKHLELWPIYVAMNELPPDLRFKKENLILVGAWFGDQKPNFNVFFPPIARRFLKLQVEGLPVQTPVDFDQNGNFSAIDGPFIEKVIKGVLITGTLDNPARDSLLNKVSFNAKEGCFCKETGETVENRAGKRTIVVHPFKEGESLLTREEYDHASAKADHQNSPVFGIQGLCFLFLLSTMNYNLALDYLHTICLGVAKKMLNIWFTPSKEKKPYRISSKIDLIDRELLKLSPPLFLSRRPRSVSSRKYWKAAEFRAWILYYSPILLKGVLPDPYLRHWLLFVTGLSILLSPSISPEALDLASFCLSNFYLNFSGLYDGNRWISINVHHLKHLVTLVKMFGPLWAYSCFPFESMNHQIRLQIHGTGFVLSQLMSSTFLLGRVRFLSQVHLSEPVRTFLLRMGATLQSGRYTPPGPAYTSVVMLDDKIGMIGKGKKVFDHLILREVKEVIGDIDITSYRRAVLAGAVFHGTSYTRSTKRNNSVFLFHENGNSCFGEAHSFHFGGGILYVAFKLLQPLAIDPFPAFSPDPRVQEVRTYLASRFFPLQWSSNTASIRVLPASRVLGQALYLQNRHDQAFAVVQNSLCLEEI